MKNILVIGDFELKKTQLSSADSSARRFIECDGLLRRRGYNAFYRTYHDVLYENLPIINTKSLKIMMFFPFAYWDSNIERYDRDNRVYGDCNFGNEYHIFMNTISRAMKDFYKNKKLNFVNPISSAILDRDKKKTSLVLKRAGIKTPPIYNFKSVSQLEKHLSKGGAVYIKSPFGSMGKGLSFVTKDRCVTNFIFRDNKIISRPFDYDWSLANISKKRRKPFLAQLIKKKFIIEKAIDHPVYKKRRFDMRVYAMLGANPYYYCRSTPQARYMTNWSQGGRIEKKDYMKKVLSRKMIKQVLGISQKVSRALDISYAGIDILFSKDRKDIYVLEAHSFPGFERGFNLMRYLCKNL